MSKAFRIGIAGLGTVGVGVIKILNQHREIIGQRAGCSIEVVAVSARMKAQDRGVDLSGYTWYDDARDMAKDPNVEAIIEVIGGSEGVAADCIRMSLEAGKHVVTANKALLAHHGLELAKIAQDKNVSIAYEAAVAGGIPIIKALREGFAANAINGAYGILNGTCNYILTQMRESGRDFADVLKDAQDLGYAEADPTFDIEGIDAAHKLCLITALAFGVEPDFEALDVKGITEITATDIKFATDFGYRIKLLGIARMVEGKIMQGVEPCLVPANSPLGSVEDAYNAVYVDGDFVQTSLLTGKGAGQGPTASAVVADIIDLARGYQTPVFGVDVDKLQKPVWLDKGSLEASYYVRLNVIDQAGVIADIAAILKDHNISIEEIAQHGRDPGQAVQIVIITHETQVSAMLDAAEKIENLETTLEKPCLIRIEEL